MEVSGGVKRKKSVLINTDGDFELLVSGFRISFFEFSLGLYARPLYASLSPVTGEISLPYYVSFVQILVVGNEILVARKCIDEFRIIDYN